MKIGRVVFVTFELYPLTGGGIGRAIYNMIKSVPNEERNRIAVIVVGDYSIPPKVPLSLQDVDIIFVDVNDEHGLTDEEATFPPRWAFENTEWHWRSYVALRALRELSRQEKIVYIEFTDWGGLGYCTTQEKKLGLGFEDVPLAVRLHGPHGVLLCTERYAVTENDLSIFDIERKTLRDCDIVVAQTEPYFEKVREIFGFPADEWATRYYYSPLPVTLDSHPQKSWSSGEGAKKILFTSKFQHIKRPEIFVRGVSQFLASREGKNWSAAFCARVTDANSKQKVVQQIPHALRSRFEFESDTQGIERDHLIARSVVVVSSVCESFCLAAFEASLLGALVVLNEENPSFGDRTLWQDGINCLKFDGSAAGLSNTLKRIPSLAQPLKTVKIPSFERPWVRKSISAGRRKVTPRNPLVSVVIYGVEDAHQLSRTMRNVAASTYGNIELIVALTGEGTDERNLLEKQIRSAEDPNISIVSNVSDMSKGASLNQALRSCSSDFVVIIRAGDLIHSAFLERASTALSRDGSIDCIGCHIGFFAPESLPDIHRASSFVRYGIVVGESALVGHFNNRSGDGPIAIRRDPHMKRPFNEELHDGLMWSFWRGLQSQSRRTVTLNATYAFCDITMPRENAVHSDIWDEILNFHEILQTTPPGQLYEGSFYLIMSWAKANLVRMNSEKEAISRSASLDRLRFEQLQQEQQLQTQQVSNQEQESRRHLDVERESADRMALNALLEQAEFQVGKNAKGRRLSFLGKWKTRIPDYELLRQSGAFDGSWYLSQYADVAEANIDPLKHYLEFGAVEGRLPNPYFDSGRYLSANPDVKEAKMNPLLHYVLYGRVEGRRLR